MAYVESAHWRWENDEKGNRRAVGFFKSYDDARSAAIHLISSGVIPGNRYAPEDEINPTQAGYTLEIYSNDYYRQHDIQNDYSRYPSGFGKFLEMAEHKYQGICKDLDIAYTGYKRPPKKASEPQVTPTPSPEPITVPEAPAPTPPTPVMEQTDLLGNSDVAQRETEELRQLERERQRLERRGVDIMPGVSLEARIAEIKARQKEGWSADSTDDGEPGAQTGSPPPRGRK